MKDILKLTAIFAISYLAAYAASGLKHFNHWQWYAWLTFFIVLVVWLFIAIVYAIKQVDIEIEDLHGDES